MAVSFRLSSQAEEWDLVLLVLDRCKQCVWGNQIKAVRGLDMTRQRHRVQRDPGLLNLLSHLVAVFIIDRGPLSHYHTFALASFLS